MNVETDKRQKRKKIRNLASPMYSSSGRKSVNPSYRYFNLVLICVVSLLILCNATSIYDKILENFQKQISTLYSSSHYCTKDLNVSALINNFKNEVIGQDEGLNKIQQLLDGRPSFIALALHGQSGSGKTLTGALIMDKFTWPENIQHIIWSVLLESSTISFLDSIGEYLNHHHIDERRTIKISSRLSECGVNLVVIE